MAVKTFGKIKLYEEHIDFGKRTARKFLAWQSGGVYVETAGSKLDAYDDDELYRLITEEGYDPFASWVDVMDADKFDNDPKPDSEQLMAEEATYRPPAQKYRGKTTLTWDVWQWALSRKGEPFAVADAARARNADTRRINEVMRHLKGLGVVKEMPRVINGETGRPVKQFVTVEPPKEMGLAA